MEMEDIAKKDKIFEKILDKYKKKKEPNKYILKDSLQKFLLGPESPNISREKIEEGVFFVIKCPLCFLEFIDSRSGNNQNKNNIYGIDIDSGYKAEASGNYINNEINNNGNNINNENNTNNSNEKNENIKNNNDNNKMMDENIINYENNIDGGNEGNEKVENNENKNENKNENNNDVENINENKINDGNNINNENKKNDIKIKNKIVIDIKFLVKAKFINEDKEEFSFWVCSFEYLKEQLMNLGYKEAKIIKKKKILFSEDKEQESKDKESGGSSSESIDNKNIDLDIELIENEVRVSKNIFNIGNIFDMAKKIFNPLVNMDNINNYLYDLNLRKENYKKLIFNKKYMCNLIDINTEESTINFYCYNQKSGVTLSLLQIFEQKRESYKTRYFHFNSEFIDKYKKKYFYFKLAKLFQEDEKELYIKIIESKKEKIINYDSKYMVDILTDILKRFKNVFIIFDNIKEYYTFERVKKIINELKISDVSKNFISLNFIQINSSTFELINNLSDFSMILPLERTYEDKLPLNEYVNCLLLNNENDKNSYIEEYKKVTEKILNIKDDSIDYLVFLIKLLYKGTFKDNNNFLNYNSIDYLIKFLPYLYIFLCRKYYDKLSINKIEYRVDIIKEIIFNQVNLILTQKMVSDEIFSQIKTKSNEGIYIEKEIIYFLITENIGFDKIKIDKIYCFNYDLENNFKNSEIIFIQEIESSPLYDFGIVINIDGETIFKGYHIGINKPRRALLNLSKNKIKMDILYFISKINKFLSQKITKFSFGIITTINAYYAQNNKNDNYIEENDNEYEADNYVKNQDKKEEENDNEYKNFKIMKNFCIVNNYEFIIFSPKEKKFYIEEDDNLKNISFNKYFNLKYINDVSNFIFSNENTLNMNKLPINPNEINKRDKEYIFNSVDKIKNKQLIIIGKFEKVTNNNDEIIEEIQQFDFNNLIDNNYLIYTKDKNENKIIYYNKKYFCNELKDFKIFYVFDTSLDKNKRGRKKKIIDLENIQIDNSLNQIDNENYLNRKRTMKKNKDYREKEEEDENSDT